MRDPPIDQERLLQQAEQPKWVVHPGVTAVKKGALPMIGATAGQIVGGTPGAMGGAGIGEYLNQKLGITEESPGQMLWAAGSQAILPTVGAAWRVGKRFAPKAGAEALHALAPKELSGLVSKMQPPVPSESLFKQAAKGGGTIPLTTTLSQIDDVLTDIGQGSKELQRAYTPVSKYLTSLKTHIQSYGNQLPPDLLNREMKGIGALQGAAERGQSKLFSKEHAGYLKRVFGALSTDLDEAAQAGSPVNWAPQAATALQGARQAFKREQVIKDIIAAGDEASFIKAGVGDTIQFRANKLLNALPGSKFFNQAFTPAEQQSVLGLLKTLNSIPAIPPGAGSSWGSGRLWQSLAAFGGSGAAVGGVPGGGIGLALGAVAPPLKDMATNIRLAMQTDLGKQLLRGLMTSSLQPTKKLLLSQAMALAASQTAQERETEVRTQEQGLPTPEPLVPELKKAQLAY